MQPVKPQSLLENTRFYIVAFSLILSVAVCALLRIGIENDQLFIIRVQQVYGFLSIAFLYLALLISPLGFVIGKEKLVHLSFARRAIGVSVFYFALLHGIGALFGQLGGLSQLPNIPEIFQWALLSGAGAFIILGMMAATSFDWVVTKMTYKKWKWLHRLVYIAGLCLILHIWLIGTHLAYGWVQILFLIALALLYGLELYKFVSLINNKKLHLSRSEMTALFLTVWVIIVSLIAALPVFVKNYHSTHTDHAAVNRRYDA